ncbi:MAG: 4Fe-4S dicluster domain-containing protein, partial [Bacillota bacterium]|nr:4Fe-4S dicluster domain-containing protein [Bacillota bacterium]
ETTQEPAYISGGPMMGNIVQPYDVVTKTTNAILVLPKNHQVIIKKTANISIDMKRAMGACCQCRMCTDLCPRHLLGHPINPSEFMRSATTGTTQNIDPLLGTMFCSQCGVCEMYACGQGLSPRTLIGAYKSGLRVEGVKPPKVKANPVSEAREYRRIPTYRLVGRLGLRKYDRPAPYEDITVSPKKVKILLSQHIGVPAVPVVKPGDRVAMGQLLASVPEKSIGAFIHASINGKVTEVNNKFIKIEAEHKEGD